MMPFKPIIATAIPDAERFKVLIYGKPGTGKTTACARLPKPLVLLTEPNGIQAIKSSNPDAAVAVINSVQDVRDAVKELHKPGQPYESIVLDSITDLQSKIMEEAKTGREKALDFAGWGKVIDQTYAIVKAIRDLPYHVAVIALAEEIVTDDSKRWVLPSLVGKKTPAGVAAMLPFVWYTFIRSVGGGKLPDHLILTSESELYVTKGHPHLHQHEFPNLLALWELTRAPVLDSQYHGFSGVRYAATKEGK